MLLLFVALRLRGQVPEAVAGAADGLLRHLSLLLVPAGVGVMLHFSRLAFGLHGVLAALAVPVIYWVRQALR